MIAPALRLVAALANGAHLVYRPRSGVVHVYAGPLTRSGRFVPMSGHPICRANTRRLSVVEPTFPGARPAVPAGRRVCRRCMPLLPAALGRVDVGRLGEARDAWLHAYGHLTPADVRQAAAWCRTVEETYQVDRVATMLHGLKPRIRDPRLKAVPYVPGRLSAGTPEQRERYLMHVQLEERRAALVAAERTDEDRAATARLIDDEAHDRARTRRARADEAAADRLRERLARQQYVAPWERRRAS